jgi:hypothetical protein
MKRLSKAGKQELAFALILLRDFKCDGKFDPKVIVAILSLADHIGVRTEYDELMTQIPPMKITQR